MSSPTFSQEMVTWATAHLRKDLAKTPKDNFYTQNNLLKALRKESKKNDGGAYMTVPILKGGEAVGGWYARGEAVATTPTDPITEASYQRCFLAEPITIWKQDIVNASGVGKIFDLITERKRDAMLKIERKLNAALWSTSQITNAITGLPLHVLNTPTSGTVGNIDRGTYTWWRNQTSSVGSFATNGLDKMRTMRNTVSIGGGTGATLIVSDQTSWEYYVEQAENMGNIHLQPSKAVERVADVGFTVASYGGIPYIWDANAVAGRQYWLNSDAFYLLETEGECWQVDDFERINDGQQGIRSWVHWIGACVSTEMRRLGVNHTITA